MNPTIDIADIPPIPRKVVWHLAAEEYRRFTDLLDALDPDEWALATDCDGWSVRDVALHILGSTEANASPRELVHQFRRGLPLNAEITSAHWVDGVNELQIRERAHVSGEDILARMRSAAPRAVRGRRTAPPPLRWLPVPFGPPIGWKPLTYLLRMGFTRDVWMHRVDIARATERPLLLSADHDGRIVADILVEWARRHREPFVLELTGPAGGSYRQGQGGPDLTLDAIEICRIMSGRGSGPGLLQHTLPL